ncbi:MAG: DUF2939 domain-containing protein [Pseudomonadota bacterium]|nr:DUF2939 domain-containing protein [Pseudomonadota bacterium]
MILKTPMAAALAVLLAGYATWPCVTLYRLNAALHADDPATLRMLVDWPAVQAGVKQDLANDPSGTDSDGLAPFGASFRRSIAVDGHVTPAGLIATLRDTGATSGGGMGLRYAYFNGLSRVVVALDTGRPHQSARLLMQLREGAWQVTRAWLPTAMLRQAQRGTAGGQD